MTGSSVRYRVGGLTMSAAFLLFVAAGSAFAADGVPVEFHPCHVKGMTAPGAWVVANSGEITQADENGHYEIVFPVQGVYCLKAMKDGFDEAVRPWLAGGSAEKDEFAALRLDLGNLPEGRTVDELVAECAAGRPVLLDFGASWCKACSLMHRTTLPALARDGALDGIAWVRLEADDPSTPATAEFLRRHQIVGCPPYILLENAGTIP